MNNLVKVSVIVPVYNAESTIQGTMKMLCDSKLRDIEIIAVNDGSTDKSLEILKRYSFEDSRIKVIDKENGGIFDARNAGLEEASGQFICFCDQDDIIDPYIYEKMYKAAVGGESDLVICRTGKLLKSGEKVVDRVIKDSMYVGDEVISKCFMPVLFYYGKKFCCSENVPKLSGTIWKCMISRSFIEKFGLRFRKYVDFEDDWLFLLDILVRVKKVILLSDVLYFWNVRTDSYSRARRYIEDFHKRSQDLINAVTNIMKLAYCSSDDIKMFKNSYGAFCYAGEVMNEANHKDCSIKERIDVISSVYQDYDFKEKIEAGKLLSNNLLARKIICRFLKGKHTYMAYCFCKFYLLIRGNNQNKSFWVELEKKLRDLS